MPSIAELRRRRAASKAATHGPGLAGPARVDKRTKNLTRRLQEGDIAVIDHQDLDRVAAEALVAAKPRAVLNAAASSSERFPNLGPEILVKAGVPLVDNLGPDIMAVPEGTALRVVLRTGEVFEGAQLVAKGQVQTEASVAAAAERARRGMSTQLAAFAANTMSFLEQEYEVFLDRQEIPDIHTPMAGRHVLIVVRGYHYRQDLAVLRSYVREAKPVIIGVDGGADAVLEAGMHPTMIVGDMDSVSDKALRCGAELVVHAYRDGRAPGAKRLEELGLEYTTFPVAGTSEDAAMLIADDKGADLIVAVGTHVTLVEFLDKGREGMASTFLTRLRVGGKLVDAKGVSQLYQRGVSNGQLAALMAAGVVALVAAIGSTAAGRTLLALVQAAADDVFAWVRGWFGG
ncbi:MAG: thiamine pyrophosphokinase [Bifidobacteriaceae bacterium]|jgi:uncharacterized membrane-anchored protein|nr:thiamine pyrophosphokinase [Bifidobacteriaceae bacterium]